MSNLVKSLLWIAFVVGLPSSIGCGSPDSESGTPARVEILVSGSQFRGANGIHFGPDGRLYIASVVTPVIAIMNPETGEIEERLGLADGVQGPDDLTFGPDGSLYWTDIATGDIGRRYPDGTIRVIANIGPGVNPITFSDDGRLFVAQCFFDDKLWEIDPDGEDEPRIIRDDLGPGCGLNGMDWGPDGWLYGPRWFHSEVVRIDVDSGSMETVADGFGTPAAVKFDSQGRLHVLDTLAGEVVRIDVADGKESKAVVGRFQASSADNLAFTEDDRLFVSSFADGFILEVLDPENNRLVSPGGINMPGGLALSEDGERLWLADFFALRALDPATGSELEVERDVIGMSEIGSVMTVHPDGDSLILTTWLDNQVKVWDPQERRISARYEGFAAPIDALVFEGWIVVSEFATGRVVRFRPSSPEDRDTLVGGLGPAGLASRDGDLFVADNGGGRVIQLAENGKFLKEGREIATDLWGPEGIAVAPDGTLYVVEAPAHQVTRIDRKGRKTIVAEGLDLHVPAQGAFPDTMLFNGIAAGGNHLYVSGDGSNVIYKITL